MVDLELNPDRKGIRKKIVQRAVALIPCLSYRAPIEVAECIGKYFFFQTAKDIKLFVTSAL